jgi:Bor protein
MRTFAGRGLLLCALALGGCYKATFIRDPQVLRGEEHDDWTSFFVFGLVGEQTLDVKQFCPDGRFAEIQTGANFLTGLVSLVTIGIYTPRKVYVTCAGGSARATLELDADSDGRPVAARLRSEHSVVEGTVTPEGDAFRVAFAGERP